MLSFKTLQDIVGRTIDDEVVIAFAQEYGAKLPLKPASGSNSNYFSNKKLKLEVAWQSEVRLVIK